jgi:hypothetical protein
MTAQIIEFATRQPVVIGQIPGYDDRVPYILEITPTDDGCRWKLFTIGDDHEPFEDQVASDLAAIALSLRPPPRTFLERLKALFTGD